MFDRLQEALQEGVEAGHFPGATFGMTMRGGEIRTGHVGHKETHPRKVPLQGTEIYDVASLTKVVATTTMTMKLIEARLIGFDTPVSDVLPVFPHKKITLHHLLTHTSGLPADIPRASALANEAQVMRSVLAMKPLHPVGSTFVYSDVGFIWLGELIEALSGETLSDFARKTVFEPLKMHDTSYRPDPARCAPTELRQDTVFKGILRGNVHDEKAFAMGGLAGHAGLFSTAEDLMKFAKALLERASLFATGAFDTLFKTTLRLKTPQGEPVSRSLGWAKAVRGGIAGDGVDFEATLCHTGFTGTHMWIDDTHGVAFALLSNAVHPKRDDNGIMPYRKRTGDIVLPVKKG